MDENHKRQRNTIEFYESQLEKIDKELEDLRKGHGSISEIKWEVENGDERYHSGGNLIDNSSRIEQLVERRKQIEKLLSEAYLAMQSSFEAKEIERATKIDNERKETIASEKARQEEKNKADKAHRAAFDKIVKKYKEQTSAPVRMVRYILGKGLKKEQLEAKSVEELEIIASVLTKGLKIKFRGMEANIKGFNGKIDKRNVKAFRNLVTDSSAMRDYLKFVERTECNNKGGKSR